MLNLNITTYVDGKNTEKYYCVYDTVEQKYVKKTVRHYTYANNGHEREICESLVYSPSPMPMALSNKIETIQSKLIHFSSFTKNKLVINEFTIDVNYKSIEVDDNVIQISKKIHKKYKSYGLILNGNIVKLIESDPSKSKQYLILIDIQNKDVKKFQKNVKQIFGKIVAKPFVKSFNTTGYVLLSQDIKPISLFKLCFDTVDINVLDRLSNTFLENIENE